MKLVGFIREHNDVKGGIPYAENTHDNTVNNSEILEKVVNYLKTGKLVLAWMGYFYNLKDNSLIAPDSYYSDGTYVWPSYYSYYLITDKGFKIDSGFLEHMKSKNFTINHLEVSNLSSIEKELSRIMETGE